MLKQFKKLMKGKFEKKLWPSNFLFYVIMEDRKFFHELKAYLPYIRRKSVDKRRVCVCRELHNWWYW